MKLGVAQKKTFTGRSAFILFPNVLSYAVQAFFSLGLISMAYAVASGDPESGDPKS